MCVNVDTHLSLDSDGISGVLTVPALIGSGKGSNITSAGWQVTLCDPMACELL